jgi:trigger factor
MAPEQFIQQIQQANQLGAVFADVRRGKALAGVVDAATVTDTAGETIDTAEMFGTAEASEDASEDSEGDEQK